MIPSKETVPSEEMQGQRGLEPNDIVFGCMLDALVCNGQVDEAVKLFDA